ncbi:MAG: T9SS type A sorting domain-containing protein, partial [Bacteroidetes bacterium]|nr:T9SS type A sorting domain-containing protein [Bacteroidota bacterium]
NYSNADDLLLKQKINEDPALLDRYKEYEKNLKKLALEIKNNSLIKGIKTDTLINGRRIIPLVFHIIHKYGEENISDAQIYDAVEKLNIDYNKLNADTSATFSLFKPKSANCQIEFRLAKIDPSGNCTSGIDRGADPRTDYAYFSVMHDYAWAPSRYMNIYAVNFIYPEGMSLPAGAFIGGMSPFPPSNPLSQSITGGDSLADGVLIRQDCIGSIGTATNMGGMPINALNRSLTHESGHYFNLYHPFQNLIFGIIPAGSGCPSAYASTGDEVDDTPPVDAASQNIDKNCYTPGSRNTCNSIDAAYGNIDAPDMIENYMDYQWGFCTNLFSLGQLDRINATMTTDRRNLWSYENLLVTGVLDTSTALCLPKADFSCNNNMVCKGSSVSFSDFSYNGAVSLWEWTFGGGAPATSNLQNPVVTYNTPGTYSVNLKVTNASGADSIFKQDLIIVSDPDVALDAPFIEGFETNINDWILINQAGNKWEITDSAKYAGSNSLWISNFSNNSSNSLDEIITPAIDITTLTPTPTSLFLKFKIAYAGKITSNILTGNDTAYDALKIFVSTDCGNSWFQRYSKTGSELESVPLVSASFFPTSASQWRDDQVNVGTYITKQNVRFKFQFISGGANNLFIDDINLDYHVRIEDLLASSLNFNVFPNPMTESTEISFNLNSAENVIIDILDIVGKQINSISSKDFEAGQHNVIVNKNQFGASGFYFIKLSIGGEIFMRKIVVN